MKIYLNNIVCPVSLHFVKSELENSGIPYLKIEKDYIEIVKPLSKIKFRHLRMALAEQGISIEIEEKDKIITDIKNHIAEYLNNPGIAGNRNIVQWIVLKMNSNFEVLNATFNHETGMSILKYYKWKKINLAIKLLTHYKLTFTEIAYQLNYKNEAELFRHLKSFMGFSRDRLLQTVSHSGV